MGKKYSGDACGEGDYDENDYDVTMIMMKLMTVMMMIAIIMKKFTMKINILTNIKITIIPPKNTGRTTN